MDLVFYLGYERRGISARGRQYARRWRGCTLDAVRGLRHRVSGMEGTPLAGSIGLDFGCWASRPPGRLHQPKLAALLVIGRDDPAAGGTFRAVMWWGSSLAVVAGRPLSRSGWTCRVLPCFEKNVVAGVECFPFPRETWARCYRLVVVGYRVRAPDPSQSTGLSFR